MLDSLDKYKNQDHFSFSKNDNLEEVCNAPKEGAGIYLIYAITDGKKNLVYIGSSGSIQNNGEIKVRQGGLYDRLVHGKQFKVSRKKSWPNQMKNEGIDTLEIHWYETFTKATKDIPTYVEGTVIQDYFSQNGNLPRWNKAF